MEKAKEFQKNTYLCSMDYSKAFECMGHNKLWKILQEIGIPDHLTCLLRNLYTGQEATVRTGHGTMDLFRVGKGVCHPAYLTCMQSTSYEMPGLMNHSLNQDCWKEYQQLREP